MMRIDKRQLSFARLLPHPAWATHRPPGPMVDAPALLPAVIKQLDDFEASLVSQGIVRPNSAWTYRKALACVCKQAELHVGRALNDIAELFEVELIAALAKDDRPFDRRTPQLSRYTKRQRRVVFFAYLRAVGVPGLSFEEGLVRLDEGLRRAATRRGYRYIIAAGRPEERDPYLPSIEDIHTFLKVAGSTGNAFSGARLAAAAGLAFYHGLRPVSILGIDGNDFRRGALQLFVTINEKAVRGKAERREIQLDPRALRLLEEYIAAHNRYGERLSRAQRVGVGVPGPLFRETSGEAWGYNALRAAFAKTCRLAGITPFPPCALRHVYASGMAAVLPLDRAASAGGWKNSHVFSKHYARSRRAWGQPPVRVQPGLPIGTLPACSNAIGKEDVPDDRSLARPKSLDR
jgi:integrase